MPGPLGAPECRGSNRLLADGAGVLWDIPEFLDAYARVANGHRTTDPTSGGRHVPASLPEGEAVVLSGIGFEPTEVDVISGRSGLEMRKVLSALALLELKGYVARGPGGAYSRRATL